MIGSDAAVSAIGTEIRAVLGSACAVTIRPDTYRSDWTWLEVVDGAVSKGTAVADDAYAVANATDAVQAAASGVLDSCDEDGVASWLERNAVPPGAPEGSQVP